MPCISSPDCPVVCGPVRGSPTILHPKPQLLLHSPIPSPLSQSLLPDDGAATALGSSLSWLRTFQFQLTDLQLFLSLPPLHLPGDPAVSPLKTTEETLGPSRSSLPPLALSGCGPLLNVCVWAPFLSQGHELHASPVLVCSLHLAKQSPLQPPAFSLQPLFTLLAQGIQVLSGVGQSLEALTLGPLSPQDFHMASTGCLITPFYPPP